jgi:hypothetical protein
MLAFPGSDPMSGMKPLELGKFKRTYRHRRKPELGEPQLTWLAVASPRISGDTKWVLTVNPGEWSVEFPVPYMRVRPTVLCDIVELRGFKIPPSQSRFLSLITLLLVKKRCFIYCFSYSHDILIDKGVRRCLASRQARLWNLYHVREQPASCLATQTRLRKRVALRLARETSSSLHVIVAASKRFAKPSRQPEIN